MAFFNLPDKSQDGSVQFTTKGDQQSNRVTPPPPTVQPVRVAEKLARLEQAARSSDNLMPVIFDAADAYATVGEISDRLRTVFGEYSEG